jgi:RNA polymerase sigma-70 factor (ECF subfamily)
VYLEEDAEDRRIVEQVLAGDTPAFERVVERYQQSVYTLALRMLGNRDEAVDATQNSLVKAYEKLHTYDARYRFFSWLYRIAVHECLNVRRAQRTRDTRTPPAATAIDPVDPVETDERRRVIEAALHSLSAEHRQVIVLRHFGELSYEEIGEALGLPVKTVKSRLYTARQQLAERLAGWERR